MTLNTYKSESFLYKLGKKIIPLWLKNTLRLFEQLYLDSKQRGVFSTIRIQLYRRFRAFLPNPKWTSSDQIIVDVVIPCTLKDIEPLPLAIDFLTKNLVQKISSINIVVPDSEVSYFQYLAKTNEKILIHKDSSIAPIKKSQISYTVDGVDRSGWLLQQLIKLNSDKLVNTENFLVFDSDTLMVKPTTYISHGKTVFYFSDEYNEPYFRAIQKVYPDSKKSFCSFVAHGMMFQKSSLRKLKSDLSNEMPWHETILSIVEKKEKSGFSEYELYAAFFKNRYPKKFQPYYWCNKNFSRNEIAQKPWNNLPKWIRTISFHDYFSRSKN